MGFEFLLENVGWVLLTYDDNSQRKVITTMNKEILESFEVTESREEELYDLQLKQWVSIDGIINAEIFEDEPSYTNPVDIFMEGFLCR